MGVVSRVHGYNSRWRAAIREHPNEYQVSVVDPIEGQVLFGSQPGSPQQIHASICHGKIRVQLVIDIFRWMNIGHRTLHGVWICGHFNFVSKSCPVGSLNPVKQLIQGFDGNGSNTIITTCFTPFASASSPHFFQYVADADSSPSIMVEPWEKKWTGVELAILQVVAVDFANTGGLR